MIRHGFDTRKSLAATALLLASFLEVCGCNPVKDCAKLRATVIASAQWSALLEECSHCLTASELTALEEDRRHAAEARLPVSIEGSRTVQQALRNGQDLSFYEPTLIETNPAPVAASLPLESKPIQWPIPESVYFVYKAVNSVTAAYRSPTATAFIISVPDRGHREPVRFLVTARHVIDPEWAHCEEKNPPSVQIRLNKRTGGVGYETIPLEIHHLRRFLTPADGMSDLALVPLSRKLIPNLDDYKLIDVPFSMLPTSAELKTLQTDEQVMTAGLSAGSLVEAGNYPVFNPGVLSEIPNRPVNIRCDEQKGPTPLNVWFINAEIPQGVSGAPVYIAIDRGLSPMSTPVLLGIQSVSWPERGVAGITPATVLGDLVQTALAKKNLGMNVARGPGG